MSWNYTYSNWSLFEWQTAGYANGSRLNEIEVLARKNSSTGTLDVVPGIGALFTGRVSTVPHNNTLIIRNLQYNDSFHNFTSLVKTKSVSTPKLLEPVIRIIVQGIK